MIVSDEKDFRLTVTDTKCNMTCRIQYLNDVDPFSSSTNFPEPPSRPPLFIFNVHIPLINQIAGVHRALCPPHKVEDCALQLYKYNGPDSDSYGIYLDLESTIDEQMEHFEGFNSNRKNAIILRTKLSVRVHSIIDKLTNSTGRDLRRALFSLKQMFQDDKSLVHEFVQNDGLACLIKVGSEADQNYQNYILRALGQVMLYVDGMEGVIEHNETIQWLYSLISVKYRLVVKTSLKLLLVFVEYSESNCLLLMNAVNAIDTETGCKPWSNMMSILNEKECADTEILIFTFTLINKTLAGIADQDTYYDMIDSLEEQGMEKIIKSFMSKKGIEKDLMKQLQIYELVLKNEDEGPASDDDGIKVENSNSLLFDIPVEVTTTTRGRSRASKSNERRRSRRHSSVGHSLISSGPGNKAKSFSFIPPKNTKVIEDLVPNWQKKALEATQQYTSSCGGNFTTSKMLQEVNNNINNLSNNNNKKEAVVKIKEVSVKSTTPPQVAMNPSLETSIRTEETTVPLKRDFRPSSTDGSDLMYNNFSGQRASISSTSSADSYGSSTSSGAFSMASSTPSSGGQKSPSSYQNAINTKSSLIEKRKRILFEKQNNSSNKPIPSNESAKRNSISDCVALSSNGAQFSIPQYSSNECIDMSKNYLMSKMYETNDDTKVVANGVKTSPSCHKMSWEPVNDTTTKAVGKCSIPGSSIGVKNIQEKILRTGAPSDHLINGYGVSSNIRDVIRNPNEFLHLHKPSSSPNRKPSPTSIRPFRPLKLNDLDFTDLKPEDDQDILSGAAVNGESGQDISSGSPLIPCPPPLPSSSSSNNNRLFQPPMPPPPPPPLPSMNCPGSLSPSILQSSTPPHLQLNNHVTSYNNQDANKNNYNQTMTWLKSSSQIEGTNETNNSTISSWSVVDGQMIGVRGCINPYNNFTPGSMYHGTLKNKKTVKLFWKEVKEEKSILNRLKKKKTIWDEITMIPVDPVKMEHLFENRTKELVNKKPQEVKKNELIILDTKRSNAINIGMTKLPAPRVIKTAILRMDSSIINREGIEKILSMIPTEEEQTLITSAQVSNPDLPLGSAENFLLILSSIPALEARLKLWLFRLDYDLLEKEMGEQLMDLKNSMEEIEKSTTFKIILGALLSMGNFLNGSPAKGFQLEYLEKVTEVKDTVQKHSLLHHLASLVLEHFPESSDLYSELGAVTRASRVDYDELVKGLSKMESDCNLCWDYLKVIGKHDTSAATTAIRSKMNDFLTDCSERINVLQIVQRRVFNRFKKMLIYLGFPSMSAKDMRPQNVLKVISEFALEYRTMRERVKEQIEKKRIEKERIKTRGKMITETEKFKTRDQLQDDELRHILASPGIIDADTESALLNACLMNKSWTTLPGSKSRVRGMTRGTSVSCLLTATHNGESLLTGVDDEILESLVKTVTTCPTSRGIVRKKSVRTSDRKSLRRTLKGGFVEEDRHLVISP